MAEYIEKQATLMQLSHNKRRGDDEWELAVASDMDIIRKLPSADVVQVVHARWENYSPITIKCSHCGHVIHDWRYSECKYCPNCGAKMDEHGEG